MSRFVLTAQLQLQAPTNVAQTNVAPTNVAPPPKEAPSPMQQQHSPARSPADQPKAELADLRAKLEALEATAELADLRAKLQALEAKEAAAKRGVWTASAEHGLCRQRLRVEAKMKGIATTSKTSRGG